MKEAEGGECEQCPPGRGRPPVPGQLHDQQVRENRAEDNPAEKGEIQRQHR